MKIIPSDIDFFVGKYQLTESTSCYVTSKHKMKTTTDNIKMWKYGLKRGEMSTTIHVSTIELHRNIKLNIMGLVIMLLKTYTDKTYIYL